MGSVAAQVMRETMAVMERRNIIGMVSGEPGLIATWKAVLADRMIAGLDLSLGGQSSAAHRKAFGVQEVRRLLTSGGFQVLGEVMAQYDGITLNDPRLFLLGPGGGTRRAGRASCTPSHGLRSTAISSTSSRPDTPIA